MLPGQHRLHLQRMPARTVGLESAGQQEHDAEANVPAIRTYTNPMAAAHCNRQDRRPEPDSRGARARSYIGKRAAASEDEHGRQSMTPAPASALQASGRVSGDFQVRWWTGGARRASVSQPRRGSGLRRDPAGTR